MLRLTALALAASLCACATSSKITLRDRFMDLGIPKDTASCMVDDLEQDLSREDLSELADYSRGLGRADTPGKAVDALLKVDNPRAVVAIGKAAFSCLTGFRA